MKCINDILPNEILAIVFEFVDPQYFGPFNESEGLLRIATVCHQWRNLIKSTPSLKNRLKYHLRCMDQDFAGFKGISNDLRLNLPEIHLLYFKNPRCSFLYSESDIFFKDPFWKSMNPFKTVFLELDLGEEENPLEDITHFLKGLGKDLEEVILSHDSFTTLNISQSMWNKVMESLANIHSLEIWNVTIPFPSGVDNAFSHLTNLKKLHLELENPDWRLPKEIAEQLETFIIKIHEYPPSIDLVKDMINLIHITLFHLENSELMTFISNLMSKLKSIELIDCENVIGHGFNPKGLKHLQKFRILSNFTKDIFDSSRSFNFGFENLKTMLFELANVHVNEVQIICQQNPGLKRVEIYSELNDKSLKKLLPYLPNLEILGSNGLILADSIIKLKLHCPKFHKLLFKCKYKYEDSDEDEEMNEESDKDEESNEDKYEEIQVMVEQYKKIWPNLIFVDITELN